MIDLQLAASIFNPYEATCSCSTLSINKQSKNRNTVSFFIFNSLEFKTIQYTWYINNTGVDTGRNKILSITIFTHYAVSTGRYVDQDTEKRQTDLQ